MHLLVNVVHVLHNKSNFFICIKENRVHQIMPRILSLVKFVNVI